MEADFIAAWEEHVARNGQAWTEEQRREYTRFATSSRQRGDAFARKVEDALGFDFRNKRVLDVGSAYGGFVLAAASKGASAFGVEVLEHLHRLAVAHAKDEPGDIHLLHGDILDDAILDQCDVPFDLVAVNDVFEHIYDSPRLFNRLSELSGDGTIIYFAIPNGESWSSINREGHRFVPGLSLLEPGDYADAVRGAFKAYYRPLQFYWQQFRDAGFSHLYLTVDRKNIDSAPQRVPAKFQELEALAESGPFQNRRVNAVFRHNFRLVRQRLDRELRLNDPVRVHLHYDQYFWEGFAARRSQPRLAGCENYIPLDPARFFSTPGVRLSKGPVDKGLSSPGSGLAGGGGET